ncbi:AAA family ATPase [Rhodopseudomonas palustris]|uniref:AAA family ATPase n=1 Tax=Rhodopseudomonas palustris TaxID=1076 RepID=UPI0022F02C3A|nr:AAA family ATPase [Rhodopseudomonas palustris]WBU31455.1 AAA family ATPase [Rhodopseudomonas palustris]
MTFQDFAALGYTRLVPIIPHDAPISEGSSLYKRVGTKQDSRGKAVGVRGLNGWYGYDWLNQPDPDEHDLARWQRMGAGVGIMTGGPLHLVLVDADTLNQTHAGQIMIAVAQHFGLTPQRVGRAPKAGYLIRVTEPVQYCRVEFGPLNDEGRRVDRVELLSDGRQFVAHGVHPVTKKPYVWTMPLCHVDKLPVVTPQQLAAFMDELRQILPNTGPLVTEGATTEVSQASLRGDIEKVRAAVAATPNTSAAFGTREAYRDFGYAIKAALPDDEPAAFEIFADWCARWEDGENDPDIVAADWRRMKPPFRRGASWIYELAEETSGGKFKRADAFFDVLPDEPESLFPREAPEPPEPVTIESLIAVDPTTWAGKTPRPREWVVEGWVPKGEVTLLYGDGGVGKSLLAMQFAACAATGRHWLGQVTRPSRVMGLFCEDSEDELFRRQADINRALGIAYTDLSNLRLFPRKHFNNVFALWDRQTGQLKLQPVWHQLADAARSFGADVVIVDTIADVFSGSEIDRAQVSAFVKSCLGRLALEIGGSVLALGHPSVSGRASGEGTSGSTAWSNAARSRLYLQRPKGADRGNTRVLTTMKANYGPKGAELIIRYQHGAFDTVAGLQPAATVAPRLGTPPVVSIGEAAEQAIVSALAVNPAERINMKPNSQYFAIKVLRALDPDSLAPFDDAKVERAMTDLLRRGAIREQQVGRDGSGRPTFGYVVVPENMRPVTPVELADAPDIAATIFD